MLRSVCMFSHLGKFHRGQAPKLDNLVTLQYLLTNNHQLMSWANHCWYSTYLQWIQLTEICHSTEERPASSHEHQVEDNQTEISYMQVGQSFHFDKRNYCINMYSVKIVTSSASIFMYMWLYPRLNVYTLAAKVIKFS
jgi:hypothetical protein